MRRLWLPAAAIALAVAGCGEKATTASQAPKAPQALPAKAVPAGDANAGRAFAEAQCKACHGVDGRSVAPGIPHLAGQNEAYLHLALAEYRDGKRTHAVLRGIAKATPEAELRNVVAHYASLPPVKPGTPGNVPLPYEHGKSVAEACAGCHGADGNSTVPGIPSLAGQQPRYLVVATQEYLLGERKVSPMHAKLRGLTRRQTEDVALYFASQTPQSKPVSPKADAKAGQPLAAVCSGCHGPHGTSNDPGTPNLAGQDEQYLVEAIKAYRTSRKREDMRLYITGLGDAEIGNIAAFYASQKTMPSERGQTLVADLTAKCDRCHSPAPKATQPIPRIHGQDRDYLVMALRAYRDDRRESSTMHKMSLPYGDSIIESIAAHYASRAPN